MSAVNFSARVSGRLCGCEHLDVIDDETHVVVSDPDNPLVSIRGTKKLFALMAVTNDARLTTIRGNSRIRTWRSWTSPSPKVIGSIRLT
jgi:hypothetical protein